jgi:hypothetical protein
MHPIRIFLLSMLALGLLACSKGGGSSSAGASSTSISNTAACQATGSTVTISGTVNFERVPFSSTLSNGLDFNNIQTQAVSSAEVQALGADDCIISTTVTSLAGDYSLVVNSHQDTRIRVLAKTSHTGLPSWDFEVRDNTNNNALYALEGSLVNSGATDSTRNLLAETGFNTGTGSYTSARVAAPFAILDSIFDALQLVVATDPSVVMNSADIFWSENNSTAFGALADGAIGSSFYSNQAIYILGQENNDTDEFDTHVLIHEWGHYFEDNLSRSDSIGGVHNLSSKLDPRVAISEGFGNAFSGMVTNNPIYRDSFGNQQGLDFQVDIETNATSNIGWFNEGSTQTILYDIYDSASDANDSVSLGFAAIYGAMTSVAYRTQSSLSSIFSLTHAIKTVNTGSAAAIDTIVASQGISLITDNFGSGEVNDDGNVNNLPVYKLISDNGVAVEVCSNKDNGEYNHLGNRQFMRLDIASSGTKTITVNRVSALPADPDFIIYLNGALVNFGLSDTNNTESISGNFNVDEYIIEVYDYFNIDNMLATGDSVCFNVTVS